MAQQHIVARCPCCERPIWSKQVAKLLGLTPLARRFPDLGFLAEGKPGGKGGWRVLNALRTLSDVGTVAGPDAVDQLRKLARQAIQRMWFQGLVTKEDIDAILSTTTIRRDPDAPRPPLDLAEYRPGSPVVAATVARPWSAPAASPVAAAPPPSAAPARQLSYGEWRPK